MASKSLASKSPMRCLRGASVRDHRERNAEKCQLCILPYYPQTPCNPVLFHANVQQRNFISAQYYRILNQ